MAAQWGGEEVIALKLRSGCAGAGGREKRNATVTSKRLCHRRGRRKKKCHSNFAAAVPAQGGGASKGNANTKRSAAISKGPKIPSLDPEIRSQGLKVFKVFKVFKVSHTACQGGDEDNEED